MAASVAPAAPATGPDGRGPAGAGTGTGTAHRTSLAESGAFVSARCTCGWRGWSRRARTRARRDAAEHAGD
ncbi:hypothetical protein RLT57_16640 [Streptomyces sp. ITFR-21]|nr:hypothetical protein [Streptomyces sp. ITFR-21]WNI19709.1 hypothetical protein RLT57_16640 [Streptomyces sp. ITFR-21]